MAELQIIGGGRMGEALLAGLLADGLDRSSVLVVEAYESRRAELEAAHPGVRVSDQPEASAGVILAVKPNDVAAVAAAAAAAGVERVLSVAAGVTIAALEAAAGTVPVVRAMPNTPALVGQGAAAIAGGTHAGDADMAWAEGILSAVGVVVRVPEGSLDAVTGLSGSGPAYVFMVAEALIEGGVLMGLPRDQASALAIQTLRGSAQLLAESGSEPAQLRADVTSPGGTTAAGLLALEQRGLRAAFAEAVRAATTRSRELGA
ncbi:MAG: pyrroline-5-carboxylate reductase [Actinomycetia bacterium]|nr:pyrroline-5-carboxylate reductase [Actinomycetes bacterium]